MKNTEILNTKLYDKMYEAQEKYRSWLLSQPPEEILNHTYEYTIREDILLSFEYMDLKPDQARALLKCRDPLGDIYKDFEKLETNHMDTVRDTIESRANKEVARLKEKAKSREAQEMAR